MPGNSGGPIFDGTTGRAIGFVDSYRWTLIQEMAIKCHLSDPAKNAQEYINALMAIYSYGLRFGPIRQQLESNGVTLG